MSPLPTCVVFTRDAELTRRLEAYVGEWFGVRAVSELGQVTAELPPSEPVVVLVDVRSRAWRDVVEQVRQRRADTAVIVAMGVPRTDPMLEAEERGVYAVADVAEEPQRLRILIGQALRHVELLRENRALQARVERGRLEEPAEKKDRPGDGGPNRFQYFSHAFRHFDNVEAMLDNMVPDIASLLHVGRAGIFMLNRNTGDYVLGAGVRCFEGTQELQVSPSDPFVRWMGTNTRFISRTTLDSVEPHADRVMVAGWLDMLRAETLIPLHGRNRLLGWLFSGQRVTGEPFTAADLADLMPLAEYISIALENALLYDEIAFQKILAETTLHSIPVGIVAVDGDGIIRWLNAAAGSILDSDVSNALGETSGKVSSRLADVFTRTLRSNGEGNAQEWAEPATKRHLAVEARRLMSQDECLGAVAIIRDMTDEMRLREKRSKLEREAFWTELAAAMSHEIRNPLVAISTFAQLLPDRYSDDEFRGEFSELVSHEIARLNSMIDQIDAFANPPDLAFRPVPVERVLRKATSAALGMAKNRKCRVETSGASALPGIVGDEAALVDCFSHLIANALEAVSGKADPRVEVVCSVSKTEEGEDAALIRVTDNGRGIPLQLSEKVFSPFCTSKARGIGLGLPIVKRTVADHGGRVTVETGEKGTTVEVLLPTAVEHRERQPYEAAARS